MTPDEHVRVVAITADQAAGRHLPDDVVGVDRDGLLDALGILVVEMLMHRGEVAGDDLLAGAFSLSCHGRLPVWSARHASRYM